MKTIILSALVLIWLSPIAMALNKIDNHQKGNTFLKVIDQNFKDANKQYLMLMKGLSPDQFPRSYNESKKSLTVSQSDWWCSGFYPGTLLYLFQQTNNKALYQEAMRKLQSLEKEQYNKSTHDLGFMMYCSFGNAYRLDPKPEYKSITGNVQFFPDFKSSYVDNRNVEIWVPAGYETNTGKKYPVLYMHDGQNLFEPGHSFTNQEWEVDETMTKLIAENKVKEAIVVGIWNTPKRFREYQPDQIFEGLPAADKAIRDSLDKEYGGTPLADAYLKFIVNELKPFVDRTFRTLPDKENTYMMGSSMGGLISIYAIAEYPQVFGGVACLSTHFPISLRHNNPKIPTLSFAYLQHKLSPNLQSKIYFDYGTETLDAWYEPYQKQMDTVMTTNAFLKGKNWETLKFAGEEHSEIS